MYLHPSEVPGSLLFDLTKSGFSYLFCKCVKPGNCEELRGCSRARERQATASCTLQIGNLKLTKQHINIAGQKCLVASSLPSNHQLLKLPSKLVPCLGNSPNFRAILLPLKILADSFKPNMKSILNWPHVNSDCCLRIGHLCLHGFWRIWRKQRRHPALPQVSARALRKWTRHRCTWLAHPEVPARTRRRWLTSAESFSPVRV